MAPAYCNCKDEGTTMKHTLSTTLLRRAAGLPAALTILISGQAVVEDTEIDIAHVPER